jgi:ABC-type branched-subunit amino acid transport system ATPase component/ABC-type branched-subunit amino acid transport system permease subunit
VSVSKRSAYSIFAALALAAALLPLFLGAFAITLLNYIGIATLVSLGLVLLTGSGGMTSFGQAAFVGIGAYTTAYLSTSLGWSPWMGLAVALAATFVIAMIIGAATLHLGGHYLPITTIAWGLAIYLLFGNFEALGRYGGLSHIPPISVFGFVLERMDQIYYLIWSVVGASLVCASNLLSSREGRAIRALRGGSALVESLGVNSFRTKLAVFVISALLAALAGWLYAHMQRFISPATFDLGAGIEYLLMAMLGGAGYVGGALVGAITVTILKNWLQDLLTLVPSNGGNLEAVAFGVIFILLLQYSPRGLVPLAARYLPHRRRRDDPLPLLGAALELSRRAIPATGAPLLTIEKLTKKFGGLTAVDEVSFKVEAGVILALIGPNGAGKSTIFNLVTGALTPTSGRVFFAGADITGVRQRLIARSGIARTFQHVKLRPEMSVLENVMLGAYQRTTSGFIAGCLKLGRNAERAVTALAREKLREVGLNEKDAIHAGNLPLGQQRIVEIARALAADPVMIMLDEPAAGLRNREKQELSGVLKSLRARGVTILLVEHDMPFLMGLADRVVVLDFGRKIAEDMPAEVRANPKVQEAYLGGVA